MAQATADKGSAAQKRAAGQQSYYWTGALPRPGEFDWRVHGEKYNRQTESFDEMIKTTADRLWNGTPHHPTQIWAGKCEKYQSIPVNGHEFVAWMDRVVRQGDGGEFAKIAYPGSVVKWRDDEFEHVLRQCWRNIVRNRSGIEGGLKSLDAGKHPAIDPNDPFTRPYISERVVFDRHTDVYVASFVYIVRIADVDNSNWSVRPEEFWRLSPAQSMEDIFRQPPPSVEEAYPESKKYASE